MKVDHSTTRSRRQPRLPANDRAIIQGLGGDAWTVNWSSRGFCLLAELQLNQGERYSIDFPDRYTRAVADVVWAKHLPDGCLAGLAFQQLERRAGEL